MKKFIQKFRKNGVVLTLLLLFSVLSSVPVYAADTQKTVTSNELGLKNHFDTIKMIAAFVVVCLLIYGSVQVYAAKSDKDPDKFKTMLVRWIAGLIFLLVAIGITTFLYNRITEMSIPG